MLYLEDSDDFVNEKDNQGYATNVILKKCGAHVSLKEAHEKPFFYGYSRKKKKKSPLGRAAEASASAETKKNNKRRQQFRRKEAVKDLVNCNEDTLKIWHTFVDVGTKDISTGHKHRKDYSRRLERFVQTGKLYGAPVKNFTPLPDFALSAIGVIQFQDGKRKKTGKPTDFVHFHQVMNTPYLPQVPVIAAKVRDSKTALLKEQYLNQKDGLFYWSQVANRDTLFFQTTIEAGRFLQEHRAELPGWYFDRKIKKLCVAALLWERGFIDIEKIKNKMKKGKCSNVGDYMVSAYMVEDLEDKRLDGRKAYYAIGRKHLKKPEVYRDEKQIDNIIAFFDLWKVQIDQIELQAEYIGAMTIYLFNLLLFEYAWMRTYYERRNQGKQMSRADWIASGVDDNVQYSFW